LSEYEILDLAKQAENTINVLLSWWGGVSFGVVALGHFASKKLNTQLVVVVVALYVGFTVMVINRFAVNISEYGGYFGDLMALQDSGVSLSPSTVQRIAATRPGSTLASLSLPIVFFGTFLASIYYLLYVHIRERRGLRRSR
jgi:hypothetical protein